jgi:hypothetical protein
MMTQLSLDYADLVRNLGKRVPGLSIGVRKGVLVMRSLSGCSGVAVAQPPGGQAGQHDRVTAQDRESGPRAQLLPAE